MRQRQRQRNTYRPVLADELEARVVLSHGGGVRGPSVLVAGLAPGANALARRGPQPVVPLVNLAFDSFVKDYTQARAAYLSTVGTAGGADANTSFKQYTMYRVDLLSQQVLSAMLQVSAANAKQQGRGPSLPGLVLRRLNGRANMAGDLSATGSSFLGGTLGQALTSTIPAAATTPAAASLSALAQDQAIAASRVNVINGFNIIKNGDFGNKFKSGK